ncbi:MAG TPA: PQQ-binding-like beta-propeller repeat protein [Xanthobacteraceae bacterium]|nr:PQQ-binding-like beta-propeller repeat protein [Xanthobacteraceae bacterium]
MAQYLTSALSGAVLLAAGWPAGAAEVTPARLVNADKEPQNWLMNHRTYDGQRYSPLAQINKDNVKGLRLAYSVSLGGSAGDEFNEATPLVEDGFLYTVDSWAVVYKIDVRSGEVGRIMWRMDPKEERQVANRGVALWGNFVISIANYPARIIATDKDSGKVVWETNTEFGQSGVSLRGAPLAIKDKILFGAAGGSSGIRDWLAAVDAATGKVAWRKFTVPAPGEPGSETWKGNNNSWETGGGAVWVTGTYDPGSGQTIWGTGNPVPEYDPTVRPGDNLFTNSAISWDPDSGKMNWYFQYTPNDAWDFDEVGTHILIDSVVDGQPRKLITHSARNGFLYTMDRNNGQIIVAKPYMDNVNWTRGVDQKTGKPLDYDPNKDVQIYAGGRQSGPGRTAQAALPDTPRRQQFLAVLLQPEDQADLHSSSRRLRDRRGQSRAANQGQALDRRFRRYHPASRKQPYRRRSDHRRDQEKRAPALPERQRDAGDRRWGRLHRPARRHRGGVRRHHTRSIMEGQCGHGLFRPADDL